MCSSPSHSRNVSTSIFLVSLKASGLNQISQDPYVRLPRHRPLLGLHQLYHLSQLKMDSGHENLLSHQILKLFTFPLFETLTLLSPTTN